MSAHTPGPWFASCRHINYDGGEWPEDEFLQWEVDGPRVPHGRGSYFQADARLIAAAPELLEALQALMNAKDEAEDLAAHNGAMAAIAKATGEQQ